MKRLFFFGFLLIPFLGMGQVVDTVGVRMEVDSLVKVCRGLTGQGRYEEALEVIEVAKTKAGEAFKPESAMYATCVFNQGRIFHFWGKFVEAESLYLEAKTIREKVMGKETSDYAWSLTNLASLYYSKGDYGKAEPLYLECIGVREKILGKEHPDYASSLQSLGNVYQSKGEYTKAEQLILQSKTIREKALGKEHSDYARSLNSLAMIYATKGEYDKAEPLYLEVKEIWGRTLGKNDPSYVQSLSNLGVLYNMKGDYDKAILMYLQSKAILENILKINHPDYALILNNLGTAYRNIGDYDKSEPLLSQAKIIREKVLGKNHPDYAWSTHNLANLYFLKKEYSKCEPLFIEAKAIREKVFGRNHPVYVQSLKDIGAFYNSTGAYEKAEKLFLEAKEIYEGFPEKNQLEHMIILNNLAAVYVRKGDYNNSKILIEEALEIANNHSGIDPITKSLILFNVANINWSTDQIEQANHYFLLSNKLDKDILQRAMKYSSEEEMMKLWTLFQARYDQFLSFTQDYPSDSFLSTAYNNVIFLNNSLLFSAIAREKNIAQADSIIRNLHSEWKSCHFQLAKQYTIAIPERDSALITELEDRANECEKEITRYLPEFEKSHREVHWQNVQANLNYHEAAIEFIHFNQFEKPEIPYAALLLLPNDPSPRFIPLCEERQLDALIYKLKANLSNDLQNLYSSPRADGLPSLYQLIWAPIEKVLQEKGVKTVYYAPSGLLHRLNLAAIPPDKSGQTLSDRYHLIPVASTRQLVTDHSTPATTPNSAIIYGGIHYEMDSTAMARANADISATAQDTTGGLFRYVVRDGERGDNWGYLLGTEKEGRFLHEMLGKRGVNSTLRLGYAATEESFKQIGQKEPSPSLLHIGTHGFFFPDPKDTTRRRTSFGDDAPVFKISEHPLIRSGLKLAGSRYAWENKRPMHGMEDGILTAYEVSQMNLSNTQLVVLSACETGLGDIKGNEGVYGLQRAFRIAGAKNVLMSLWKVPDEATEILLTEFYKNWLEEKMPLRKAFEAAQVWMRRQEKYHNPYFWAGFVLIGEI